MNVRELIAKLRTFNEALPAAVADWNECWETPSVVALERMEIQRIQSDETNEDISALVLGLGLEDQGRNQS